MIRMKREFSVIIEKDEDNYYIDNVFEIPGCRTQTKTLDELNERIKEAIELYLEVKKEELDFSKNFLEYKELKFLLMKLKPISNF